MIMQIYRVFGSGHAALRVWVAPDLTVSDYVARMQYLQGLATDDGHDGFVGTRSVDDSLALSRGIETLPDYSVHVPRIANAHDPQFPLPFYRKAMAERPFLRDVLLREADLFLKALNEQPNPTS